ncbi:hypothetical protein [Georgenia sp. AZ-5]|uniref:hypothetical protein n=1 Tax=Georgenia sp. AZ-5 TaxID=3367526 RepID=UPI0037551A17
MADLPAAARDRVRAMTLWLVAGIVLVLVGVGIYAVLVGFDRVRSAPVEAVAVAGHDLVVRYVGGAPGCGDPHHLEVDEDDDAVVVSAFTVARHGTRWGFACARHDVRMYGTVRLAAPLGERPVRDGARPDTEVPVVGGVEELVGGG